MSTPLAITVFQPDSLGAKQCSTIMHGLYTVQLLTTSFLLTLFVHTSPLVLMAYKLIFCLSYNRVRLRGIKHLVFYGLPQHPQFYSEMCNMLHDVKRKSKGDNQTCTVLYTKFDVQKLAEVVGTDRAGQMINSQKSTHMFVTGENG